MSARAAILILVYVLGMGLLGTGWCWSAYSAGGWWLAVPAFLAYEVMWLVGFIRWAERP